ncbi:uracil-DNA glycosylase [Thalassotalea litorea]|uniref:Uracil-DNA glycosylase n=1 Tax=Thalassotalea litorea TaxID=2020715 RepID=A0A5R9IRQ6_9GAMM|nr:uracil-DNA glycosylase [Thalassotalea litorea]TLU67299.1 uracil-DNA glycosylase [Thalassotalea litorea]
MSTWRLPEQSWQSFFAAQKGQAYFQEIEQALRAQRHAGQVIYPPDEQLFRAFELTPLDKVKVVVLGQDPYHGPEQAHGLAFSVNPKVKLPPSLRNIFKELEQDIEGFNVPVSGDLTSWAKQGVLLLNTVLSVQQGKAHSHSKLGWEIFTHNVMLELNSQQRPIVYLLWGTHAQNKGKVIDNSNHQVLTAVHPSPLSAYRGFFGCRHFSLANEFLKKQGEQPIDWQLSEEIQHDSNQGQLF